MLMSVFDGDYYYLHYILHYILLTHSYFEQVFWLFDMRCQSKRLIDLEMLFFFSFLGQRISASSYWNGVPSSV